MKIISYLQNKLGLSRRNITGLIDQGCIFVNGGKVEAYKQELNNGDELFINSVGLNFKEIYRVQDDQYDSEIIIFNKPIGYVVSKSDPNNKTIYDILPKELKNYYYIGRLDKDSHGLLLLTNNPKLVNEYEHPKNQIKKEYIVQVNKPIGQNDIKQCLKGIEDEGEILKIKSIEKLENDEIENYKIILTEGKKRHIRRIFKFFGNRVIDLQRISEGDYKLGNIKTGERESIKLN
ncbi:MAG: pseudouridine synthase [Candidatus Absconditicoccaceae bacterium]